eukprot:TRINITY_DN51658_c0_g1_i1.p1 TRINITY_DN51658_c0_g1~~TRINITY_DN51658_c0_g1_i1.p1  ORF type:complete len:262 (+),score=42.26 TRINITY_DN51658_c0_g1_i1:42-827(+)
MIAIRSLDGSEVTRIDRIDHVDVASVKHEVRRLSSAVPSLSRLVHDQIGVLNDGFQMKDLPMDTKELQLVCLPVDPSKGPVLWVCVVRGLTHLLEKALYERGDPNATAPHGDGNLLLEACARSNLEIAALLCQAGADVDKAVGEQEYNAVFAAAEVGCLAIIELLVSFGADIHKPVGNFATPLHAAANRGHLEVVQFLCAPPAQGNSVRPSIMGALSVALRKGRFNVAVELLCNAHWILLWPWERHLDRVGTWTSCIPSML